MLKYLSDVPNGIESLVAGLAVEDNTVKIVTKMRKMLRAVCELEKEESAEKKAIFRLGQMDMRESVLALLRDHPHTAPEELAKLIGRM